MPGSVSGSSCGGSGAAIGVVRRSFHRLPITVWRVNRLVVAVVERHGLAVLGIGRAPAYGFGISGRVANVCRSFHRSNIKLRGYAESRSSSYARMPAAAANSSNISATRSVWCSAP